MEKIAALSKSNLDRDTVYQFGFDFLMLIGASRGTISDAVDQSTKMFRAGARVPLICHLIHHRLSVSFGPFQPRGSAGGFLRSGGI